MKNYDIIIIGAGPGGIFAAYRLLELSSNLKIAIIEKGRPLSNRKCPIDNEKIKTCVNCKICSIMSGFGGAGAFSDGKFNITNDFGGTLYEYIGETRALELMARVDKINNLYTDKEVKLYSTNNTQFEKICMKNNLKLLNASVRHFGTDINYEILENIYQDLVKNNIDFYFEEEAQDIIQQPHGLYIIKTNKNDFITHKCIISVGRSGSSWVKKLCSNLNISTISNKVDIGVRVELPYEIFAHITDELYESKILYKTQQFEDKVRTFCMNPRGIVVNENVDGYITVNGHSFEAEELKTNNTNFALLVSKTFTEPFNNSNEYGQSIVKLSNMLGGGVIIQQFGDLIRGRRTTEKRLSESMVKPTLSATPGDLSLVLPKRILDDIIEMIYALDKVAPGTANPSTLLYGVEVKYYNMQVEVDKNLQAKSGLYFIGDGSGITHSLSHASASGIYVAEHIMGFKNEK